LNNASENRDIRKDIKAFMLNLADGIQYISAGDPGKAKAKLLKARSIWPEYFGTDFLLARVNEDTGNYKLSAQFYKSYLNKLKAFSEGRYRISAPLMRGITPYRIENYDAAYALVRDRLKARGINLANVSPFYTMPGYFVLLLIFTMLGLGYSLAAYTVIPHVKRWWRINNPPPGSWACKKCGTHNLNVRVECEKCGERIVQNLPSPKASH
jgi:hypothetical protein